jgi:hypothetical protein
MADEYTLQASMESEMTGSSPFVKRESLSIVDQQQGSYNGRISFDTSRLATSGRWVDLRSAEIHIPFTIVSKSSANITGAANAFMAGLKAGTHHIIDSMSVRFNNQQVLQETPLLNHYVHWKMLSSFSQDDLKKHGSSHFFDPDSGTSFRVNDQGDIAVSLDGQGVSNNRPAPADLVDLSGLGAKGAAFNAGFQERLRNVTDLSTAGGPAAANLGGLGDNITEDQAKVQRRSYFADDKAAGAARVYTWHILARIRLRDLSDFFDRMPLVKSPFLQLTFGYNTSSQTISRTAAVAAAAGPPAVVAIPEAIKVGTPTIVGNTNPIMIASGATKNPNNGILAAAGDSITFACGIAEASGVRNTLATSCQLVCDSFTMNPAAEKEFLSTLPQKMVTYTDLHYQLLQNQTGTFQTLLTGGLKRAKRLIIIPYYSKAANTGLTTVPVYQSPFASEPGTTSAYAALTNLQVQVSGVNLWQAPVDYGWDMYKNEVSPAYSVNGGLQLGTTTGLLSEQDWTIGYRYIVADLSRRMPADEDTPKSIQVSATIASAKALDLLFFIEYDRSVTVDTATSAITSSDL